MSDKSSAFVLDDYVPEAEFAEANNLSQRTVARYRNMPDGIPWMLWNGQVHIHIPGARDFVARRVKYPNPSRRQAVTQPKRRS
jgi:hypothetical protein